MSADHADRPREGEVLTCCDVEVVGRNALRLTMRDDQDLSHLPTGWAKSVLRACPGDWHQVQIDLRSVPVVSSTFVAGALEMRESLPSVEHVILLNVSDRVVRLLEIMNLRGHFVIHQQTTEGRR